MRERVRVERMAMHTGVKELTQVIHELLPYAETESRQLFEVAKSDCNDDVMEEFHRADEIIENAHTMLKKYQPCSLKDKLRSVCMLVLQYERDLLDFPVLDNNLDSWS